MGPSRARGRRRSATLASLLLAWAAGCDPGPEPPGTGSRPASDSLPPRAATSAPEPASADEAALRELSDRWIRGLTSGSPDSVASVYSVQAEVFLPGSDELLLGQDAVREHLRRHLAERRVLSLEIRRSAFVVRPEIAYSLGVWNAVTVPAGGGPPDSTSGHLTDVYRRDGTGPWVVAHEHASLLEAAAADTARVTPF